MDILTGNSWYVWLAVLWLAPLVGFTVQILFGNLLPRNGDWVSITGIGVSFAIALTLFGSMFTMPGDHGLTEPKTVSWTWVPVQITSSPSADHAAQHEDGAGAADDASSSGSGRAYGTSELPSEREELPGLSMGFYLDNMAIILLLVVTGVSFLVHVYSVGYMHDDPKYHRFFAFLNLFSFSMLGLVLVDNLIGLYIFWELVGVSSYLLIGFWFEKEDLGPAKASIKAFLTTRVGDIGMFIGILLVIFNLGVLDYQALFASVSAAGAAGGFGSHAIWTLAGVMLFLGAVGKSAQFPLHIWLPDAMEGPTPVSALIHAATMVAAGVYMVARLFPFFTNEALLVIAVVGAFTALFAATMALVADDIKQVLAYSTISQLGYMVLALGVGAWKAGFIHLYTHAFFKALLFLCSGSVIHAVHTNDMWKMGGLRKAMPWTFATMLVASLSISGIPFFSGFISKDKILFGALLSGMKGEAATVAGSFGAVLDVLLPVFAFVAAVLTAFYMFRLIFLTFTGEPRDEEKYEHAHESPNSMVIPLVTLATFSLFFIVAPNPFATTTWFDGYVKKPARADAQKQNTEQHAERTGRSTTRPHLAAAGPASSNFRGDASGTTLAVADKTPTAGDHGVEVAENGNKHASEKHGGDHGHGKLAHTAHSYTFTLSLLVVALGIGAAGLMYWEPMKMIAPGTVATIFRPLYILFERTYYLDELFYYGFVIPSIRFARFLAGPIDLGLIDSLVDAAGSFVTGASSYSRWWDDAIVDGLVDSTADGVSGAGNLVRSTQTGNIRTYLGYIGGGILALIAGVVGFVEFGWGRVLAEAVAGGLDYVRTGTGAFLVIVFAACAVLFLSRLGNLLYDWFRIGYSGE